MVKKVKFKFCLLGGNGFLGLGLQDVLRSKSIPFVSIDKSDVDLADSTKIKDIQDCIPSNTTHIVLLAANLGRKLFSQSQYSTEYFYKNINIAKNVFSAISNIFSSKKQLITPINLFVYSTSEIYGSLRNKFETITYNTAVNPPSNYPRSEYAKSKIFLEQFSRQFYHNSNCLNSIHIIRPFNITGKHQRRGVVYDMVKSAILEKKIYFSYDTLRSFTSNQFAANYVVKVGLENKSGVFEHNLTQNLTFSMEKLANIVRSCIQDNSIDLVKLPPDKDIRYRQTSIETEDEDSINKMKKLILQVLKEVQDELGLNLVSR